VVASDELFKPCDALFEVPNVIFAKGALFARVRVKACAQVEVRADDGRVRAVGADDELVE